jgi:hypothetical protein
MGGNTITGLVKGGAKVAKHPATHYSAGIGGVILALMAWLSPIIQAQPVKQAMEQAPEAARVIAKDAADAAVKPLSDKIGALDSKVAALDTTVGKLKIALIGDEFDSTNSVTAKIRRIEEALTRMAQPK